MVGLVAEAASDAEDASALASVVPALVLVLEHLEAVPALRPGEVRRALHEPVHRGQLRVHVHGGAGEHAVRRRVVGGVHGHLREQRAHQRQEQRPARRVPGVPAVVGGAVHVQRVDHRGVVVGTRQEVPAGVPRRAQVGVERGVAVAAAEAAQPGERVGEATRADPRVRDVAAAEREPVRRVRRSRADGRRREERGGGGGVARQREDEAGQVGGERAAGREVARGTVARVLRVRGGAGHERQGGGQEDKEAEAGESGHVELARPALAANRRKVQQES